MEFEKKLRDRKKWSIGDECSMAKALDLLSTKTTFLVLRECFYGTTRFEDFVERIGTSAPAVSRAMKQLESAGIITRVPYQEPGRRVRDEYRLTPAGKDLLPVFLSLVQWGDKHLHNGQGPLRFVDAETGRPLGVRVTDEYGATAMDSDGIEIRVNSASKGR
ncbi:winged helix-turn-helix transcriptional regulator [Mycobacterium camsae]|uniref:winged helix-turn-helix transcriptional regulator n=1 Tax=Mycobacterium gordonae TaxID=1778 RepID=UPI00197E4238|nr:helix-turn-helix domain-containing protein [Mycobacterium gordonae]